jgi:small GTP-binding protein
MTFEYDYLVKLLLVGDSGVGKSSLMLQHVDRVFEETYAATIGVDFKLQTCNVNDKIVRKQLWDSTGQERFMGITTGYYKGIDAIMIVYDVTSDASFNNVKKWLTSVDEYAKHNPCLMLVGNKCDCPPQKRMVDYSRGAELAKHLGIRFIETSAKAETNVDKAFEALVTEAIQQGRYSENKTKVKAHERLETMLEDTDKEPQCCSCIIC